MAPDQRRAAIISASLPLVLEHGLDVTTRELAEAARVAEGTLFRVFPDKEALIRSVVAAAVDPEPAIEEMRGVDPELPLRLKLEACVEIMQRRLSGVFTLLDALHLTGPPPDHTKPHGHCPDDQMNDAFQAEIVHLIEPDAHQLRVPPIELAHVMRLLAFSATHPRIADGHTLTARQIVSVLLDGLRRHPAGTEQRGTEQHGTERHGTERRGTETVRDSPDLPSPGAWPTGRGSTPPIED